MNWKYTDETKQIVFRTLDDGRVESCFVTVQAIQDYLSAGGEIDEQ